MKRFAQGHTAHFFQGSFPTTPLPRFHCRISFYNPALPEPSFFYLRSSLQCLRFQGHLCLFTPKICITKSSYRTTVGHPAVMRCDRNPYIASVGIQHTRTEGSKARNMDFQPQSAVHQLSELRPITPVWKDRLCSVRRQHCDT